MLHEFGVHQWPSEDYYYGHPTGSLEIFFNHLQSASTIAEILDEVSTIHSEIYSCFVFQFKRQNRNTFHCAFHLQKYCTRCAVMLK